MTGYIKGAPEVCSLLFPVWNDLCMTSLKRVLAKCNTYLKDGAAIPITEDFSKKFDEAYNVRSDDSFKRSC